MSSYSSSSTNLLPPAPAAPASAESSFATNSGAVPRWPPAPASGPAGAGAGAGAAAASMTPTASSWNYMAAPATTSTPTQQATAAGATATPHAAGATDASLSSLATPGFPSSGLAPRGIEMSSNVNEVRVFPLTAMTGTEGSALLIRVTLPASGLEQRVPGQVEPQQFHIVFGSFLVIPQVTYEQPPAQGLASIILGTHIPMLLDLPGVHPDNISIRIQARLVGSRQPTLHPVGSYRMLPNNPAQVRANGTSSTSPDLWANASHQPHVDSQYGPVRSPSATRRDVPSWDPANPCMRARYFDQHRAASPSQHMVPRQPAPPLSTGFQGPAPMLVRAPQTNHLHDAGFMPNPMSSRSRAILRLQGDLGSMAYGWTVEELQEGRRLVQFWRKQEVNLIHATFRPIMADQYVKNSIVVSCIFRADRNECFVTSVDTILLLEALVASRFSIEEKNRIRRNLEGFHPETVRKQSGGSEEFFKRIMNFKDPKPRTIAKDVKTFPWKVLELMLQKVLEKYTCDAAAAEEQALGVPPRPTEPGMHISVPPVQSPGQLPVALGVQPDSIPQVSQPLQPRMNQRGTATAPPLPHHGP